MRRTSPLVLLILVGLLAGCTSAAGAATTVSALVDIGSGLQGPSGLVATVYATGLSNVSAFAFDDDGRLWAATAAYDDDADDAVYLIATAGAPPVKVIADVGTPLGLVWADDTLYVSSSGGVRAYSGLVDSAFAERSTVLALPAGVGEVNGLVMSAEGRLVLGISAPCDACVPTTTYAAAVVSFRPDGSDLRVEASGIRAPVGLTDDPISGDLFVTMNQRDDLGDATPGDWLAIVESGQAWGFPGCYGQGGAACDGTPEPLVELDAHAAVSGVAIVTDGLGPSLASSALVAEWATGKVLRVALTRQDGTITGRVEPFLTGLTNPVPLITAPNGTVLVGDWGTGTIYRIATA